MKRCCSCKKTLPLTLFHICRSQKDGVKKQCKKCRSIKGKYNRTTNRKVCLKKQEERRERYLKMRKVYNKTYMSKTKDKRFAYRIEKIYGISILDYDNMFISQNEKCKICGIDQKELPRRFCVDHCHSTGKIRGLLCDPCNRLLGQAKDSSENLRKAADYLEQSKKEVI